MFANGAAQLDLKLGLEPEPEPELGQESWVALGLRLLT